MIPQSFIQDLLSRVDIVDVVGRAVKLKKAGANLQGLCPFHNEKSPSFTVSPTKQFYHCFGCGAHGSAIGFMMEHHGLSYVDAIHDLAAGLGLTVPQEGGRRDGGGSAGQASQAAGLVPVLEAAAAYYRQRLRETPRAIDYLKSRELTGATAARFGLGFAPAGWRSLEAAVPDYGDEAVVTTGLVIKGEDGKRYDRFRDRIMFPIRNSRGQVIGFGGRVLDQGEPKYLNSPEGPLFSKGRELYGLFEAREGIRRRDRVLVVEGYMDVVMLHQHGVDYAVATLGTATTAAHLGKLMRQAERIVFAFDGDAAGRRAAWRALENALPLLSDTRRLDFLFLPEGHDPDSFIRSEGLDRFEAAVEEAMPLSVFLVRELCRRVDLGTPEGRARLQAELKPLVRAMPDIALRGQIALEAASRAGVGAQELLRYVGLRVAPPAPPRREPWRDRPAPVPAALRSRAATPPGLEARIRLLLAYHPSLAREPLSPEFLPATLLEWRDRIAALPAGANFAVLLEGLKLESPEEAARLAAEDRGHPVLVGDLTLEQARHEYADAVGRLKLAQVAAEIDSLAREGLETQAQRARYKELMGAKQSLSAVANA